MDFKPHNYGLIEFLQQSPHQQVQPPVCSTLVVFLSDGGDTVRNLQLYLNPEAEHLLDWFHVTMRLTVLNQIAKGLPMAGGEDNEKCELRKPTLKILESIKWYLWHGNTYEALEHLDTLVMDLDVAADEESKGSTTHKLLRAVEEFQTYIANNKAFTPNYGERYHQGDRISTGFVESTVNYVVAKRFAKRQQMQWSPKGAHLLLQMRTRVLNRELEQTFQGWHPGFRVEGDEKLKVAD